MVEEPEAEPQPIAEEDEGGPVKSFLEHLEDLRWVLIKSAAALAVGILVCLIGGNFVVGLLKRPLLKARLSYPGTNQVVTVYFGTNQFGPFTLSPEDQQRYGLGTNRFVAVQVEPLAVGTNQVLGWHVATDPTLAERAQHPGTELINLSPAEGFYVAFQVAFYGGIALASPFIFYFIASFVFPALKMKERYYVYRGLAFGLGLFTLGIVFCYFALMPVALAASQKYSAWLGFAATQWKAGDYISFVCKFMLGMGLGFEMPVVILTLVKIGILDYAMLSKARKYMIVINLILGAVLTTPEVITQLIMFLPLQCLFEVSVWVAWYWERQAKKREAAAEAAGAA